jgi:hypothetical protein
MLLLNAIRDMLPLGALMATEPKVERAVGIVFDYPEVIQKSKKC